jgi:hypothetical protein
MAQHHLNPVGILPDRDVMTAIGQPQSRGQHRRNWARCDEK